MLDMIKFIVGSFADKPDLAEYIVEEKEKEVNVTIVLEDSDMGKVIGRQGKIAKAMRTLVKNASAKSGKKYNIEIKEKSEVK